MDLFVLMTIAGLFVILMTIFLYIFNKYVEMLRFKKDAEKNIKKLYEYEVFVATNSGLRDVLNSQGMHGGKLIHIQYFSAQDSYLLVFRYDNDKK